MGAAKNFTQAPQSRGMNQITELLPLYFALTDFIIDLTSLYIAEKGPVREFSWVFYQILSQNEYNIKGLIYYQGASYPLRHVMTFPLYVQWPIYH